MKRDLQKRHVEIQRYIICVGTVLNEENESLHMMSKETYKETYKRDIQKTYIYIYMY